MTINGDTILSAAQINAVTYVSLLTDLKALPVGGIAFLAGRTTFGDSRGGFYYWDPSATGSEDTQFMNIIPSNNSATGRWIRLNQKAKAIPQGSNAGPGVLVNNGGVLSLYTPGTTNGSGEATLYMTDDGTPTGNALFTEIWSNDSKPTPPISSVTTATDTFVKSQAADLKSTVHGTRKSNTTTISILGTNAVGLTAGGSGIGLQFVITGANLS